MRMRIAQAVQQKEDCTLFSLFSGLSVDIALTEEWGTPTLQFLCGTPSLGVWDLITVWILAIHRNSHSERGGNPTRAQQVVWQLQKDIWISCCKKHFAISPNHYLPSQMEGRKEKSQLHYTNQVSSINKFVFFHNWQQIHTLAWILNNHILSFLFSTLATSVSPPLSTSVSALALLVMSPPRCTHWKLKFHISMKCKTVVLVFIFTIAWHLYWLLCFQISELPLSVFWLFPSF